MGHNDPIQLPQLPFITREMFDWGAKTEFDLEVVITTEQTITFQVSGATKESPFSYNVTPIGNIDRESQFRRIAGIPVFLSVHIDNTNARPGEMWVEVYLRAGNTRLLKMVAGYLFPERGLTWPTGPGNTPFNEMGPPIFVTVANPAAGANFDIGLASSQLWKIDSISFRLVTDANAADRRAHVRLVDNGGVLIQEFFGTVNQTASTTRDYVFQPVGAVPAEADNDIIIVPIPPNFIANRSMDLESAINNIQVGDQLSNIRIYRASMALET